MRKRDVRYSAYDANGNDNPIWKGKSVTEMLKAVVSDPTTSTDQKKDATAILEHVSRRAKKFAHLPALDQQVQGMLAQYDADSLWEWPSDWNITVIDGEELVRRVDPDDSITPPAKSPEPGEPEDEPTKDASNGPLSGEAKLKAAKAFAKGIMQSIPHSGE